MLSFFYLENSSSMYNDANKLCNTSTDMVQMFISNSDGSISKYLFTIYYLPDNPIWKYARSLFSITNECFYWIWFLSSSETYYTMS